MQNMKMSILNVPIPAAKATIRRKIATLKKFYKNGHTPPSDPVGQMVALGMKTKDIFHFELGRDAKLKMALGSPFASSI